MMKRLLRKFAYVRELENDLARKEKLIERYRQRFTEAEREATKRKVEIIKLEEQRGGRHE